MVGLRRRRPTGQERALNGSHEGERDERHRLYALIGEMLQANVHIERAMHFLWLRIVGPTPAWHCAPTEIQPLLEQVRLMIVDLGLSDDELSVAREVLAEIEACNNDRNRAAHDMWFYEIDGPDFTANRIARRGMKQTVRTESVATLQSMVVRARLVDARLHGLQFALPAFGFPAATDEASLRMLTMSWEIARGEFETMPEGGIRTNSMKDWPRSVE